MTTPSDLAERLRDAASRIGYYDERGEWVAHAEWMLEAADLLLAQEQRIEKLRRSIERCIARHSGDAQEQRIRLLLLAARPRLRRPMLRKA